MIKVRPAVCLAFCANNMRHLVCQSSYSLHHQPKKLTGMMHSGPATLAHRGFCPTGVVTALVLIRAKGFGSPLTLTPSHTPLHATLTCCQVRHDTPPASGVDQLICDLCRPAPASHRF